MTDNPGPAKPTRWCCESGAMAHPGPCPWHAVNLYIPTGSGLDEATAERECTCTPLPDAEGPCAWCDIHGLPSVAFEQGVAEGEHSGRVVFEMKFQGLRADRDRLSAALRSMARRSVHQRRWARRATAKSHNNLRAYEDLLRKLGSATGVQLGHPGEQRYPEFAERICAAALSARADRAEQRADDAAHASLTTALISKDRENAQLRAELSALRDGRVPGATGVSHGPALRRAQATGWGTYQDVSRDLIDDLVKEAVEAYVAVRFGTVETPVGENHRENSDHNAVMTGVARALDREGLTWEQIEEVTDACLTYVENHHGVRCPGEMCPNSYRGENAERELIEHYLRAHSEAAVKYLRAHGLYDTRPGHAPEQGEPEEVPWAACGDRRTWHDGHVTTCTAKGPHEHHSNGDGARWAATAPAPVSTSLACDHTAHVHWPSQPVRMGRSVSDGITRYERCEHAGGES